MNCLCPGRQVLHPLRRQTGGCKNNYTFISGIELQTGEDGEHLTKEAHKTLGQKVLFEITKINQIYKTENEML